MTQRAHHESCCMFNGVVLTPTENIGQKAIATEVIHTHTYKHKYADKHTHTHAHAHAHTETHIHRDTRTKQRDISYPKEEGCDSNITVLKYSIGPSSASTS